jgi:hypothetical protein
MNLNVPVTGKHRSPHLNEHTEPAVFMRVATSV